MHYQQTALGLRLAALGGADEGVRPYICRANAVRTPAVRGYNFGRS